MISIELKVGDFVQVKSMEYSGRYNRAFVEEVVNEPSVPFVRLSEQVGGTRTWSMTDVEKVPSEDLR